jgi:hypothetical protein
VWVSLCIMANAGDGRFGWPLPYSAEIRLSMTARIDSLKHGMSGRI